MDRVAALLSHVDDRDGPAPLELHAQVSNTTRPSDSARAFLPRPARAPL